MNQGTPLAANVLDGFALSPQQARAWRYTGAQGRGAACHAIAASIAGDDAEALRRALLDLLARQEILRTRFDCHAQLREPLQLPQAFSADLLALRGEDWRALHPSALALAKERDWQLALSRKVDAGIDAFCALLPGGGMYVRLAVAPLAADAGTLAKLLHAAVGGAAGADPIQYADLSAWLSDLAVAEESEAGRRYWRAQAVQAALQDGTGGLRFDKGGALAADSLPRQAAWPLDDALRAALAGRALEWGLREEDLYFGSWLWLLKAVSTGQALPPVGIVMDGLSAPELAQAYGPLERPLPFVLPAGCELGTPDGLRAVARVSAEMREVQDCFPEDAGAPLPYLFQALDLGDLPARVEHLQGTAEPFRAKGAVLLQPGNSRLFLDYHSAIVSDADAGLLLEQWSCLLGDMAAGDGQAPFGLRMTPALRGRILQAGAGPVKAIDLRQNVVSWMEQTLRTVPGGRVIDGTATPLEQIDAQANRLARGLVARGIGKGRVVGLYLPRSADYVVAMLAVLKAGAAYMPMDTAYPRARIDYMVGDARPALVIVSEAAAPGAPLDAPTCAFESMERECALHADDSLGAGIDGSDLAYVLYTSGSTGNPKGVMIEHRALYNHMRWMLDRFRFDRDDVFLQRTSSSFDASVWEFWAPLLVGASMVIARQDKTYDMAHLIGLMDSEAVTVAQFVPSLLATLVEYPAFTGLASVRSVFVGGEALVPALKRRFFERMNARLCNLYGPTEACIDASFQECTPADGESTEIGRPIDNTRLCAVDAAGRLAGFGIPGELCIAGAGLFAGYMNRADLSAERMFTPTFSDEPWYRTGDLACLLPDGRIEYLGRLDQQVKLNGLRIELAEIDAAIEAQAGVRRAVTVVGAGPQLVGFVDAAHGVDLDAVLDGVRQRLPAYMVPARLASLVRFPELPNGKLDRKALCELADSASGQESFHAADTPTEQTLARIWNKVLGRGEVSVTDRFFSIGGDSIRSIQVVYEAGQCGLKFTVLDVFKFQTIRALAAWIDSGAGPAEESVPVLAVNTAPDWLKARYARVYPATEMQRYMIERYQADEARTGVFHAQQAFNLTLDTLDIAALAQALSNAGNAVNYRTRFVADGGQCFQVVTDSGGPLVEIVDVSSLPPAARKEAVWKCIENDRGNRYDPFDTGRALLRAYLYVFAPNQVEVIISNHHAVQDGWGNIEFLNRAAAHYLELAQQHNSPPRADDGVCEEFALMQQAIAADPAQHAFWVERAATLPAIPEPHRRAGGKAYASETVDVEGALIDAVNRVAREHNLVAKSVYLAAFIGALRAHGMDCAIGVVSNGRSEQLSDPLHAMGLFWNLMPFGGLPAGLGATETCLWIQDQLLALEPYSRYPLRKIEQIGGGRLVSAAFNYVDFHNQQMSDDAQAASALFDGTFTLDNFGMPIEIAIGVNNESCIHLTMQIDTDLALCVADFRVMFLRMLGELVGHLPGNPH